MCRVSVAVFFVYCLIISLVLPDCLHSAEYNFGDMTSKTLTGKAWSALLAKDYDAVMAYVEKCYKKYTEKALNQQASLTDFAPPEDAFNYWALNDVAACLFVKGKALRAQDKKEEAKEVFEDLINNFTYGQCWDPQGWFWQPSEGAKDQIFGMEKGVDFGNYTSETLAIKGWSSLEAKEYEKAGIYADKCVQLFGETAGDMQSQLTDFAPKEKAFDYWALNDVGTCLFIKAKAVRGEDRDEDAKKILKEIIDNYSFAQCWDTNGWFWSVAEAAQNQIEAIDLGVDFGNSSSETLTFKAWENLALGRFRDVEIYVDKCLKQYSDKAKEMQASLTSPVDPGENLENKDEVFKQWALNDVGTCLFIKGKSFRNQEKKEEAKKIFQQIIDNYAYAQCWDPNGWFWQVAKAAKNELEAIEYGVDFGNASSETLTAKAWENLELGKYREVEVYVNKCIELYGDKAKDMQASMTEIIDPGEDLKNKDNVFQKWALNDTGTCLFIYGKSLREQDKKDEAIIVFKEIIADYSFAQCWDAKGWFWSVAQGAKNEIDAIDKDIDFGDSSSLTLTIKAWENLELGKYHLVDAFVDKCVELYEKKALKMQASLKSIINPGKNLENKDKVFKKWALNDVGTCLFIKGRALQEQGKKEEAKVVYKEIMEKYAYAQCWDSKGWFWSVASGAKNQIASIDLGVDFGDFSSETLTGRAWQALDEGKYEQVQIYVDKCLELYGNKAKEMQASLKAPVDPGAKNENKDKVFKLWALNDTGTSLFILGRAYYVQGKNDEAKKVYNNIIENYSYAQCWDTKGWFWKPSEGAKDQILLMDTGIDFGDYTSMTLTVKAWKALDAGEYDEVLVFVKKCFQLYSKVADDMQESQNGFLTKEDAFDAWALNDIGTCYFIMGEAYLAKQEYKKAMDAYKMLIERYFYAQCWDPKGWFWKPAVAARGKINKIAAEQGLM